MSDMVGGSGFGGPFAPSQTMELQRQIGIFKCIKSRVPIPPELLMSFVKRHIPKTSSPFSSGLPRPKAFGEGLFQIGFMSYPDPDPGRCRRTDGKKWRCSKEAVPNQKYCERHMHRGRNRSRKLKEAHTSHASKLVPSASSVSIAGSSSGFPAILDSSPGQLNRMITISTEQNPFAALTSAVPPPPDCVLSSNNSLLCLPTDSLQNSSFLSSVQSLGQAPYNLINDLPSCSSSPLPENLILPPPDLTNEFNAFDTVFDTCLGVRQSHNIMGGASVNGPLGEVVAMANNRHIKYANRSSSSNIRTEEWDLSPDFCSSLMNVQENTLVDFPSTSAAGSCNKGSEDLCGSGNVNSPAFPPLPVEILGLGNNVL